MMNFLFWRTRPNPLSNLLSKCILDPRDLKLIQMLNLTGHFPILTFICFISSNICSGGRLATALLMDSGASSGMQPSP